MTGIRKGTGNGQGKINRHALGDKERTRMLNVGYSDWMKGRVSDRHEIIKATGDNRIHKIAEAYLDSNYQDDLVVFIEIQEELTASVRRRRMARAGLLPPLTEAPEAPEATTDTQ